MRDLTKYILQKEATMMGYLPGPLTGAIRAGNLTEAESKELKERLDINQGVNLQLRNAGRGFLGDYIGAPIGAIGGGIGAGIAGTLLGGPVGGQAGFLAGAAGGALAGRVIGINRATNKYSKFGLKKLREEQEKKD